MKKTGFFTLPLVIGFCSFVHSPSRALAEELPAELAKFAKALDAQRAELEKAEKQWDHLFDPFASPWGAAGEFLQKAVKLSVAKDDKIILEPNNTPEPLCKDASLWRLTYLAGNRLGGGSIGFGGCFPEHFKAGNAPVSVRCAARAGELPEFPITSQRVPALLIEQQEPALSMWQKQLHPCLQLFRCCWGMTKEQRKAQSKDLNTSTDKKWLVPFAEFLPTSYEEMLEISVQTLAPNTEQTEIHSQQLAPSDFDTLLEGMIETLSVEDAHVDSSSATYPLEPSR